MRKLVVDTFVSLDGVMQAPGGPDEDTESGFAHGGWTVPFWDEQMGQFMIESTHKAGALLLGRKTYDIFAAAWPLAGDDDPFASVLNRIPKHVASRTLTDADLTWHNSAVIQGDLAESVRALKQRGEGELQVPGSSELIQSLLAHDLIDEFRLLTFPVVLGSGKRLFGNGALPRGLQLVSSTTSQHRRHHQHLRSTRRGTQLRRDGPGSRPGGVEADGGGDGGTRGLRFEVRGVMVPNTVGRVRRRSGMNPDPTMRWSGPVESPASPTTGTSRRRPCKEYATNVS